MSINQVSGAGVAPPVSYINSTTNVIKETILAVAVSVFSLIAASSVQREAPIVASILRGISVISIAIWLLRRLSGSEGGQYRVNRSRTPVTNIYVNDPSPKRQLNFKNVPTSPKGGLMSVNAPTHDRFNNVASSQPSIILSNNLVPTQTTTTKINTPAIKAKMNVQVTASTTERFNNVSATNKDPFVFTGNSVYPSLLNISQPVHQPYTSPQVNVTTSTENRFNNVAKENPDPVSYSFAPSLPPIHSSAATIVAKPSVNFAPGVPSVHSAAAQPQPKFNKVQASTNFAPTAPSAPSAALNSNNSSSIKFNSISSSTTFKPTTPLVSSAGAMVSKFNSVPKS